MTVITFMTAVSVPLPASAEASAVDIPCGSGSHGPEIQPPMSYRTAG